MIIGICAKKQCGKSSMASYIKSILDDKKTKEISFAKPLKDFIHEVFDIPKNNLYGSNNDKNYPLCTWGEIFEGPCLRKYKKKDRDLLSAREMMQIIGTDVMRYGELGYLTLNYSREVTAFIKRWFGRDAVPFKNIWVDLAIKDIKVLKARNEIDVAIVSDVRFENEVNAIKEAGGALVRLYRDTNCQDSIVHTSETEMEGMKDGLFNFILPEHKNTNLNELRNFTIRVLQEIDLLPNGGIAI